MARYRTAERVLISFLVVVLSVECMGIARILKNKATEEMCKRGFNPYWLGDRYVNSYTLPRGIGGTIESNGRSYGSLCFDSVEDLVSSLDYLLSLDTVRLEELRFYAKGDRGLLKLFGNSDASIIVAVTPGMEIVYCKLLGFEPRKYAMVGYFMRGNREYSYKMLSGGYIIEKREV